MKLNDENYTTPLTIIAYEIEVMKPKIWDRSHGDGLRQLCMQRIRDAAESTDWFLRSDPVHFDPGRVLVSHEVMSALGYTVVNHWLNRLTRGRGCDGPCCGLQIASTIYYQRQVESWEPITDHVWLLIAVNRPRKRTVIRFTHERLVERRKQHMACTQ